MCASSFDNSEMTEETHVPEWSLPNDLKVMERLHHIGWLFVRHVDYQDIMTEIVDAALFFAGTDIGHLQIYDPESNRLKIIAHRGFEKPYLDFKENATTDHGACGAAIKSRMRVIVEDVTQSEIYAGTPALNVQLAAGIRAVQSTPLMGRSGKPLGMLSTHFRKSHRPSAQTLRRIDTLARHAADIIDRIQAENDLKESEARLRALLLSISEVFYRMSPDWREMRQLHSREFLSNTLNPSRNWLEAYIHPDDQPHVTAAIAEAIRTKSVFELEHRVRRKDGTLGWMLSRAVPLMDKHGDIVEWFGAASDVTERKQAEKAMHESEARFRGMFDNMSSGVAVYEAIRDGEDFVFKDLNRSGETIEQVARQDLIGKSVTQMFPSVIDFGLFEVLQRVWRTGLPQHHPISLYKDQRISGWRENYVYKLPSGEIVAIYDDVTDRKQAEEALRQANQGLEQRVAERTADLKKRTNQLQQLALDLTLTENRERRQLAAILHDDFQQEVAYIKFELNRLARCLAETDIKKHLMRLAQLTDACIGKMRHLSYALNPPALQRSGLLAALDAMAKNMQEHHGLTITLHTEPGAEPASSAVASILYRSIRELLFNVFKHAGVNAAVVDVRRRGEWIRVEVADQGKGFDYSTIRNGQGRESGFGLYNIEDRLKFMDGSMQITTRPGKGCCVVLAVPLKKAPKSTAPLEKSKPAAENGPAESGKARIVARPVDYKQLRILLVEDHKLMRKGVAELLQSNREMVIVGEATNGLEAVELAVRLRPHVILMDVTMPKMDGVEATARIAADHPDIRIIGLSMHNDEDTRQKMLNAGASEFLVKTDSPEKLTRTILRVHHGSEHTRQPEVPNI